MGSNPAIPTKIPRSARSFALAGVFRRHATRFRASRWGTNPASRPFLITGAHRGHTEVSPRRDGTRMTLDEYLEQFIEGYLFEDLRAMAPIRLAAGKRYGAVGYPMVMGALSDIEVLGVLTSRARFNVHSPRAGAFLHDQADGGRHEAPRSRRPASTRRRCVAPRRSHAHG